ncbi:MAG: ATP-binding protein, partial [Gemmiger sp.]
MRTKDELFQEALRHIAARRQRAVTEAERMRAAAYQIHPELREAEEARTQAGLALAMAAARGGDRESAARALEQAAANRDRVFAAAGYAPEDLEPHYTCPVCGDTGTINGARCQCVAEVARSLRRSEINAASPLALCGFDTFLLDRYPTEPDPELGGSPREYMGKVLAYARQYAEHFGPDSRGLMFIGSAGLGKTHLALAIADTVLSRGFDVLYASSAALAAQLGREHFDRDNEDPWLDACKEAD